MPPQFYIVLRTWRAAYGLTQAEAAEWLGVSRSTYSRYEGGRWPVPYRQVQRITASIQLMDRAARHALDDRLSWDSVS